jgi:dipeptidyl aminopeptidase/acylaminoacyl peptidase
MRRVCVIALGVFSANVLAVHTFAWGQLSAGPAFDARPVHLPKMERSLPRSISNSDLLAIRDLHGIGVSPNGKYVAFVVGQAVYETNAYRTALFVVGTQPGSRPKNLGSAGVPHWDNVNQWASEAPQWSPDSRFIAYRARWSPYKPWQVWRWSRKGGPPKLAAHIPGDVIDYKWAPKNQLLLTVTKRLDRAQTESIKRSRMEQAIPYDGKFMAWSGEPVLDQVLAREAQRTELWIHDGRNGTDRRASSNESLASNAASAGFDDQLKKISPGQVLLDEKISPGGSAVAFRTWIYHPQNLNHEQRTLFLLTKGNDTPVELTPGAYYVDEYWWSPDGDILYYTEYAGDGQPSRLMARHLDARGGPKLIVAPSDTLAEFSTDRSGRHAACTRENTTTPAQVAWLDLATGLVRTLADINPEFKNIELEAAEREEGTNGFGETWFGHLVKPAGYRPGRRYPLIVTLYRSGDALFLRGGTGDEFPVQMFAANGFAVLSFDVGMNRTFTSGDFEGFLRTRYASVLASLETAIQNLINQGIVEPGRVGICGLSRGTETVEFALTHSDLFQAAITSGGGGRDPYFYYMSGKDWRGRFADWGLAGWPEGAIRRNWQELSLSLRANLVKAPLLMNTADSEMLPSLSTYTALKELNKTVELYIYANERHIKNQPKHRFEIYNRNLEWFERWLKAREDRPAEGGRQR